MGDPKLTEEAPSLQDLIESPLHPIINEFELEIVELDASIQEAALWETARAITRNAVYPKIVQEAGVQEPTIAVDAQTYQLIALIKDLQERFGCSILIGGSQATNWGDGNPKFDVGKHDLDIQLLIDAPKEQIIQTIEDLSNQGDARIGPFASKWFGLGPFTDPTEYFYLRYGWRNENLSLNKVRQTLHAPGIQVIGKYSGGTLDVTTTAQVCNSCAITPCGQDPLYDKTNLKLLSQIGFPLMIENTIYPTFFSDPYLPFLYLRTAKGKWYQIKVNDRPTLQHVYELGFQYFKLGGTMALRSITKATFTELDRVFQNQQVPPIHEFLTEENQQYYDHLIEELVGFLNDSNKQRTLTILDQNFFYDVISRIFPKFTQDIGHLVRFTIPNKIIPEGSEFKALASLFESARTEFGSPSTLGRYITIAREALLETRLEIGALTDRRRRLERRRHRPTLIEYWDETFDLENNLKVSRETSLHRKQ